MRLDLTHTKTISGIILDTLEETGYDDPTEAIPGLVQAIVEISGGSDQLLDAAANLLADCGVD